MSINDGLIRPKYINTELLFLRSRALDDAREAYTAYSATLNMSERLAKLSLSCLDVSGPKLSYDDISRLRTNKFLLQEGDNPSTSLTAKGVVAVNMVAVEIYDDDDIDFYLREPFVDLDILRSIHSGVKKSSTILI